MKAGTENRKKTIVAGAMGAAALVCLFIIYNTFFGGPDAPPPSTTIAAPVKANVATTGAGNSRAQQPTNLPGGAAPGVEAKKLASANSSLDPTLDEAAMLRTESLVYSGTGRNIFSAVYTPPAAQKPLNLPVINPRQTTAPPPAPAGPPLPPPPPPINLKFFGTATRPSGLKQVFLLSGDDVYLAAAGDIVARKYKIGAINANSVIVTDLTNNNTQSLPLQMN